MFYIGLYSENHENIFFSETIWPRVLIFAMLHHLVNFYQVCSNYVPGAGNGPPRGSHVSLGLYSKNMKKIFLSETTRPRALMFGMGNYLVVLYQVFKL